MLPSLINHGALSLAMISLLTLSVAGEVFEKLSSVPQGWHYSHAAQPDYPISLKIALKQHDVEGFEQALMDMSTPGHENYGKHFREHDEMKRMLLPSETTVNTVQEWLKAAGITDYEVDADWINFRTTVKYANALLETQFDWYENDVRHITRLRTLKYSIPEAIAGHIDMIQPTTRFGQLRPDRATHHTSTGHADGRILSAMATASNSTSCDSVITPKCLKDLYKVGDYMADPKHGSKIGFASYLEEYARYDDMVKFQNQLAPYAKGQNFSVVLFNGGVNDQSSGADSGEANLDLQTIMGLSSPLPITEYITAGRGKLIPDLSEPNPNENSNEPYLEFLQNILKLPNEELPQVISTSYGEDEQTIPKGYAKSVCNLLGQLGSRGVSVVFSSGDSGVGSACQTNDGRNKTHFNPQFPATCPWVTSVGATSKTHPEQAVYFSSGGFSDMWERPAYQEEAVSAYLHTIGDNFSGLYNKGGRAFPDVAAQGESYAIFDKGVMGRLDGTSCAAPAFSAIISLLNDARLRAGKPVMGFLNPWLYGLGRGALNDIVKGGSKGCDGRDRFGGSPNGSPVVPFASWNATEGWDPVTGLGTPNFAKMMELAL
ncbi:peptidase S8/S53 domain-containing protein [Aspergillus ambiguus]|uniref:S53 family peptidase n=1 Tax=Aspergillus ambiguus TaxID=176160 RepID=UPI003CCD6218